MKNQLKIVLLATTLLAVSTVSAQVNQRFRSDRDTRVLLNSLNNKVVTFQREVKRENNNTVMNGEERIDDLAMALHNDISSLSTSVDSRGDSANEVTALLNRATRINTFLDKHPMGSVVTTEWRSIRSDVNTLAGYYHMSWNWNEPYPSNAGTGRDLDHMLTGTYRLNSAMSDNAATVVDRSLGSYAANQRDSVRRNLERRLKAPGMIAIQKQGRLITVASNFVPQVTFESDGVPSSEIDSQGRTVTTKVTTSANGFDVDYNGDRVNDYKIKFAIEPNGRLKVTRRIYLENRNDMVTVSSVYDRINDVAEWSIIPSAPARGNIGRTGVGSGDTGSYGGFYVPNGVALSARLQSPIKTNVSQFGDRFTMEVTSPRQYRGAILEGHVEKAAESGRLNGRARIALDFDTILIKGERYPFSGMVEAVNAANGDSVTVNNEGTIRDSSQGNKTAMRTGIGAALGAVIGAIAGGGEGAAIGAGVGAGAGAGSILATGRDQIDLGVGSTFSITSSPPANAGFARNQ